MHAYIINIMVVLIISLLSSRQTSMW